jgi:hypothetical protein
VLSSVRKDGMQIGKLGYTYQICIIISKKSIVLEMVRRKEDDFGHILKDINTYLGFKKRGAQFYVLCT